MKIAKILSAAAATVVAASALAAVAGAEFILPESANTNVLANNSGSFGIAVYATGEGDCPASTLAADAGFDYKDVASVSFTVQVPEEEREWFDAENQFSGAIIYSIHTDTDRSTKNWMTAGTYWGINDPEIDVVTVDPEGSATIEAVSLGDYTYQLTCPIADFETEYAACQGTKLVQYRIFMQAYEQGMAQYNLVEASLYNANGAVLATIDGSGNILDGYGASAGAVGGDTTTDAPSTDAPATDAGKGSPDTGVEGIAAVAGLGVVAAGAVVMSKKRR